MSVESDLKTVLATACARVFPDFAPVNTTRPYLTYQQIGGEVINFTSNDLADLKNGEFQVNVWADSRASAASTMLAIEAALRASAVFTAQPMSAPVADYDADVPVYGARQDWSIWSTR